MNEFNGLTSIGNTLYFSYHVYNVDQNFARTTDVFPGALYRIDPLTGLATKVGDLAPLTLVWGSVNGVLYGSQFNSDFTINRISRFDPNTAAAVVKSSPNPNNVFFGAVATPEPGSWILLGAGLAGLAIKRRR